MKNMIERVMTLDTQTRYKVDGVIMVTPEDYESEKRVCRIPRTYRARVALAKNGGVEIVPLYLGPSGKHRYKELSAELCNGRGYVVRETQELFIIRISVDVSLPKRQRERLLHQEYLKAMAFVKAMED